VRHVSPNRLVPANRYAVAQVNIGRVLAPLASERMAGFVASLEPINALADGAPGFVWRLMSDDGDDATSERFFGEHDLLVNMSVWRDLQALGDFVFRSAHVEVMRQRRLWFAPMMEIFTALWWIPSGVVPTLAEAEQRLLHLREHGPTLVAFTFRSPFPAPGAEPDDAPAVLDDWACPV
jgi:Domain of unknown function (DUF3291)